MPSKRFWLLMIAVLLIALMAGCAQEEVATEAPEEPAAIRVALILPGRIDDLAWNQAGYRSFLRLEGKLGNELETAWVENIYTNVDIVPALRDFANRGYDIIIGHGFQFQEPLYEVAPEFSDVYFVTDGWEALENVSLYDVRTDQTGYLEGYLAASMTETGKIGYVAGMEVAELARFAKGYELGAKAADPDIDIRFVYTGDFHDVAGARETVIGLAAQDVDVVAFMGDGTTLGALAGCQEAKVWCMGNGTDLTQQAPELILTNGVWQWDAVWEQIIEDYKAGTSGMESYWADIANGGLALTTLNSVVPEEIATELAAIQEQITSGTLETGGP